VGIAQKLAQVPLLSGSTFRLVFLALALALWFGATMRIAASTRSEARTDEAGQREPVTLKDGLILGLVVVTFALLVWGIRSHDWDFNHLSALFFIMAILVGLLGGLGVGGTAEAYVKGFRSMAFAALLIGFARAISVVLEQGHVVDTLVHGIFTPLGHLPLLASALGMVVGQAAVHVPVPSVSGQAVLTMPILVPLSDLLGMSRQVTILAYQFGGGLCDLITPTNGALMAILAAAGVRYEEWMKYMFPVYLGLVALGAVAIGVGIAVGLT